MRSCDRSDDTGEAQIRGLVQHWAQAVHAGVIEQVVMDHAEDIVMFDVPPPHRGLRGLAAYRAAWPDFFQWQAGGGCFEIDELSVTAGDEVAYAFALLRCDTAEGLSERPDLRLRLTLGLRCDAGRWVVAHEHHSFADTRSAEVVA